jgi:hypothetical protein
VGEEIYLKEREVEEDLYLLADNDQKHGNLTRGEQT